MLWETKGNRRNTFCLHTHMFIIPNFHFSEQDWVGSCSHHKRGIFLPDFAAFKAKRGGKRTSATAAARALAAAASGHRRAEEKRPGGAGRCPPFAHSRRESEGEKIAPDQVCEGRGAGEGPGPGKGKVKGCGGGTSWTRSPGRCRRRLLPIAPAAPEPCRAGGEGLPAATLRGRSGATSPTTALYWCVCWEGTPWSPENAPIPSPRAAASRRWAEGQERAPLGGRVSASLPYHVPGFRREETGPAF